MQLRGKLATTYSHRLPGTAAQRHAHPSQDPLKRRGICYAIEAMALIEIVDFPS